MLRIAGRAGAFGARDILGLRPGLDSVPIPLVATEEYAEQGESSSPVGQKRTLFTVPVGFRFGSNADFYDITSDDRRFLMARPRRTDLDESKHLILVRNFFTELRERMDGN